jgi:hypothetical protein
MRAGAFAASWLVAVGLGWAPAGAGSPPQPGHAVPHALPEGAARGFPFGSALVAGQKRSLLPPDASWVAQWRVAGAPRLGPWRVQLRRGYAGWPPACRLASKAQLKDLVRGVTGLHGAPVGAKGIVAGQGHSTPHETRCTFTLATSFQPPGYTTFSSLEVQLFQISKRAPSQWAVDLAAQRAVAQKYPTQFAYYHGLPGGARCFDDGTELRCVKGLVYYWVSGEKVTGGSYFSSDQAVWVEQAELPLAEVLGTELSTRP